MSIELVVFLHGVGSEGAHLLPLAREWRSLLPDAQFRAPNAPHAFDLNGHGHQWFSIAGVTAENREERLQTARHGFDSTVQRLVAEAGLEDALEKVAFVGFSQGSIMALDGLATGRWPVGRIVAFSGRLATPLPLHPALRTKVLLIHGKEDPIIPAEESIRADGILSSYGVDIKAWIECDVAHTISPEGIRLAGEFLT